MKKEKRLVPKRRFVEDKLGNLKSWLRIELGDISEVTKLAGFEFTKYIVYSNHGTIIALRGLNIKNNNIVLNEVKYIDKSDFTKLSRSKLFKGDILLTYVGTIGELAIIPENNKYYLAPNVARIRLIDNYDFEFIAQLIGSKLFYKKTIYPLIATSSQPALSMENIRKFELTIPHYKEQQKIGEFFKVLDERIANQERKIAKVKALKSAYLTEMFPQEGETVPKRRFKEFDEEWTRYLFSDILKNHSSKSYLSKPKTDGKYEVIQQGDQPLVGYSNEIPFNNYKNVVLFGDHTLSLFKPMKPFLVATDGIKILEAEKVPGHFLYVLLIKNLPKSEGYKRHLTILQAQYCLIPNSIREQQKIGEFFKNLDDQITTEEKMLEKLKKMKEAYLEEMFV